jgi:hypothetical protein
MGYRRQIPNVYGNGGLGFMAPKKDCQTEKCKKMQLVIIAVL